MHHNSRADSVRSLLDKALDAATENTEAGGLDFHHQAATVAALTEALERLHHIGDESSTDRLLAIRQCALDVVTSATSIGSDDAVVSLVYLQELTAALRADELMCAPSLPGLDRQDVPA